MYAQKSEQATLPQTPPLLSNFGGVSPFFWLLEETPKSFYNFIDTDLEAPTFEWILGSSVAIVGNLGGSASREK